MHEGLMLNELDSKKNGAGIIMDERIENNI